MIPARYSMIGLAVAAVFICYIDRVIIAIAIIPMAADFGWSAEEQGRVLASFFVGYLLTQLAGGWLAQRFGGKVVLGAGVVFWSLFTLLTPVAAAGGLTALIVTRVLMGVGEGSDVSSDLHTLWSLATQDGTFPGGRHPVFRDSPWQRFRISCNTFARHSLWLADGVLSFWCVGILLVDCLA